MAKRTNKEAEEKVIELYKSGFSMKQVGEQVGVTAATVLRILNDYNIPKRTKGGIYKIPDDVVIERYKNGESCQQIADSFNVTFHSISSILEKYNIERKNRYQNLSLDIDYFEKIDRPDKAYFLGFLLTDGNISKDGNIIRLVLAVKDEEILRIFSEKTGNQNKIGTRIDEKHNERIFQLKCAKWKQDLAKYSIVPNKTFTCTMPTLSKDMMPHLIRGMIDGDGWVTHKRRNIGFCGNEQIVTQLRDFLVKTLGVRSSKVSHPEPNLYQVQWAARKDVQAIGNYMYKDKQDCYLKRKYQSFLIMTQGNTELID